MTDNRNDRSTDGASVSDADAPLDPAAMYALLQNQQRNVEGQLGGFVPSITAAWGVAWLVGFTALWLIDGLQPSFGLPTGLAFGVFATLLVLAGAISTWLGIRSGRGINGSTSAAFTGTVYGATWAVGMTAIGAFGGGLQRLGMSTELSAAFFPSAFVMFAGIMYMVAGAIWRAVPSLVVGVWIVLVAVVAVYLPYPSGYLLLAVAGGGAFLALAIWSAARLRKARAAAGGTGRA